MTPINPQVIANAKQFLLRADIKGAEVPAFTEVFTMLTALERDTQKPHEPATSPVPPAEVDS